MPRRLRLVFVCLAFSAVFASSSEGATVEPAVGDSLPPPPPFDARSAPGPAPVNGRLPRPTPRLNRASPGLAEQLAGLQLVAPAAPGPVHGASPSTLEVRGEGLGPAAAKEGAALAALEETGLEDQGPPEVVDLNTATSLQLMRLPGIGPGRAIDIIRYRRAHPFKRVSELLRIPGLGKRTFDKIRPYVRVGDEPAAAAARPTARTP